MKVSFWAALIQTDSTLIHNKSKYDGVENKWEQMINLGEMIEVNHHYYSTDDYRQSHTHTYTLLTIIHLDWNHKVPLSASTFNLTF